MIYNLWLLCVERLLCSQSPLQKDRNQLVFDRRSSIFIAIRFLDALVDCLVYGVTQLLWQHYMYLFSLCARSSGLECARMKYLIDLAWLCCNSFVHPGSVLVNVAILADKRRMNRLRILRKLQRAKTDYAPNSPFCRTTDNWERIMVVTMFIIVNADQAVVWLMIYYLIGGTVVSTRAN